MNASNQLQHTPPPFELPGMDEAWQAHLFALTVHLNERGVFSWAIWVDYFSKALRASGQAGLVGRAIAGEHNGSPEMALDPGQMACDPGQMGGVNRAYFLAWQEALEQLLSDLEIVLPLDIGLRAQASACYPRLARAPLVFRALAQAPGKAGPA